MEGAHRRQTGPQEAGTNAVSDCRVETLLGHCRIPGGPVPPDAGGMARSGVSPALAVRTESGGVFT